MGGMLAALAVSLHDRIESTLHALPLYSRPAWIMKATRRPIPREKEEKR